MGFTVNALFIVHILRKELEHVLQQEEKYTELPCTVENNQGYSKIGLRYHWVQNPIGR